MESGKNKSQLLEPRKELFFNFVNSLIKMFEDNIIDGWTNVDTGIRNTHRSEDQFR